MTAPTEYEMASARKRLENPLQLQLAIIRFPLRVAQLSLDASRVIKSYEYRGELSPEVKSYLCLTEAEIRNEFARMFGYQIDSGRL